MKQIKKKQSKNYYATKSIILICTISVFFAIMSIYSLYQVQKKTGEIYLHPYVVSNTAREMQARLQDMRSFVETMLTSNKTEKEIQVFLSKRYRIQKENLAIVTERYLGPKEDTAFLEEELQAVIDKQNEALIYARTHSNSEIHKYIEDNIEPLYEAMSVTLTNIIAFADSKILQLDNEVKNTAMISILITVIMAVCLLVISTYFYRVVKKGEQDVAYREMLFDTLSITIDTVFLIYNSKISELEYITTNVARIVGLEEADFRDNVNVLYDIMLPEDAQYLKNLMLTKKEKDTVDAIFHMKDERTEELKYMKLRVYPNIESEKAIRYIISISDQSDMVRSEQILKDALLNAQHANNARQEFLSRMSHEIRTPMNAIIGMTLIATTNISNQERVEDCLKKISFSSKHLMSLLNDILDMSKIEDGKMDVCKETFDLKLILNAIFSIYDTECKAQEKNFDIQVSGVEEELLIGDSKRMNQILLNLLSNAVKFTPKGGSIVLKIEKKHRKADSILLCFTVCDTGIGMSQEFMQRLFNPFEQADNTIAQKYGGTGLGMSITKNLVTLMDGTIHVKSKLGEGSCFSVELPFGVPEELDNKEKEILLNQGKVKEIEIQNEIKLSGYRVLVAEDNVINREIAVELLHMMEIEVDSAEDGKRAVEKFLASEPGTYHGILMDIQMPIMDGYQATEEIRLSTHPQAKTIPIIAMTANAFLEDITAASAAGMNSHIAKPVEIEKLYHILKEFL